MGLVAVGGIILLTSPTRYQKAMIAMCGQLASLTLATLFVIATIDGDIYRWLKIEQLGWGGRNNHQEHRLGFRTWVDVGRQIFWVVSAWGLALLIRRVRPYFWHLCWMIPVGLFHLMIFLWPAPPKPPWP